MKLKINYFIILLIIFSCFNTKALYSVNNYSGLTYTLSAGNSYIIGFYNDYLTGGFNTRFNTYYNPRFFTGNTYFKGGLSYYSYNMESSKNSTLSQFDMLAGAGIFYTVFNYIDLLAGVDLHGIYSNLKTSNTGRNERAIKPGFSYNLGAMAYLGKGIGLCALGDYREMKLSDIKFTTLDFNIGLTYNYNSYTNERELGSKSEKKLTMFNQGLAEFKRKNFYEAKALLHELYGIDSSYPGLDYYMKKIEEIEQYKKSADSLIQQQNYLKSIPHLEGCSPYIKECELNLLSQRKNLKANVPVWEADGIKLYDEKKYKDCIEIMEKILVVDPENQNANIYLPRAVKRQKAIESLQGR